MFLFKRLFNADQKTVVTALEHRANTRYVPGAAFPLRATMQKRPQPAWPAKVINLSGNGIAIAVDRAAPVSERDQIRLGLTLGPFELFLEGTIAHVRSLPSQHQCGVALSFGDFPTQKAYYQVLQPVVIGQTLAALAEDRVIQNEPQFIKRVYRGEDDSVLTIWLSKTMGTPLHSFEFQTQDYFCHADAESGVLEAYARESSATHKGRFSNPVFESSPALHAEIRQLFRWILPNLSAAVPDDVKAFMQRFAD